MTSVAPREIASLTSNVTTVNEELSFETMFQSPRIPRLFCVVNIPSANPELRRNSRGFGTARTYQMANHPIGLG
jgi:hypothetical protein